VKAVEDAIQQAGVNPTDLVPLTVETPLTGHTFIPGNHVVTVEETFGDDPLVLQVITTRDEIKRIQVLSHSESPGQFNMVNSVIPPTVLDNQSTADIDIITGATATSNAFITAIEQALEKAGVVGNELPNLNRGLDAPLAGRFIPGQYFASVDRRNGPVNVMVVLGRNSVVRVRVTEQSETPDIWATVYPYIREQIEEADSTLDIDVVTGATSSFDAVIEAVQDAMQQAGQTDETLW